MNSRNIAAYLTRVVDESSEKTLVSCFRAHERRLRLDRLHTGTDDCDDPGVLALCRCLAPDPNGAEARDLIERSRAALATNAYFHAYLEAVARAETPAFARCLATEGVRVLADVLAYALLLERVTRTVRADPRALRSLLAHLESARAEHRWRRHAPVFLVLKFESVEAPLRRILTCLEQGMVEENFGRWALALNIAEASLVDWVSGKRDNAAAGWLLARTSGGRAYLNDDGTGLAWSRPAAKAWADLYTVWDLAFIVGNYANFPFVVAKLLIPAVAGYADDPDSFMYNRVIALHLQLNWGIFLRCELGGQLNLDWPHAELTVPGGASNRRSADDFRRRM